MDSSIKQYADSLYEKTLAESAVTVRRESTNYLLERSKTQDHRQLFSGVDFQAQVRIYANHIERSTAARLDSYQKAYSETNRLPTEGELREILDDFKATWELQINHSTQALSNFLAARNAPAGLDVSGDLRATSAHGHDRVLQEWKIWRDRVQLQRSTSKSETRTMPRRRTPNTRGSADKSQSAKSDQGNADLPAFSSGLQPLTLLRASIDKLPQNIYALGVVGIVAAAVISITLAGGNWLVALGGGVTVLSGMVLLRIFAVQAPASPRAQQQSSQSVVLTWFCLLAFVIVLGLLVGKLFFTLFPSSVRQNQQDGSSAAADCCIVTGRLVDNKQEGVSGAQVSVFLLGAPGIESQTFTDKDGYYSFRLKRGFVVDISYVNLERKLYGWWIAEHLVIEKNLTLPTVVVGQKSPLEGR